MIFDLVQIAEKLLQIYNEIIFVDKSEQYDHLILKLNEIEARLIKLEKDLTEEKL